MGRDYYETGDYSIGCFILLIILTVILILIKVM